MSGSCSLKLPARQFSPGRIGQIACWLYRRTRAQAFAIGGAALAIVTALDLATVDAVSSVAPLYIVPIALACWMFGPRDGILATIGVTLVATAKEPLLHDLPLMAAFWTGALRGFSFAVLAAIVLSFRHSHEYVLFLAAHDRMTGALNKESFNEQASMRLEIARMTGSPLLLVVLDLDGFKGVNDRQGHEAGDDVLQDFSAGAARELRSNDIFGRVGGDEFALVLPVGSMAGARELAHDLHERFSAVLAATGRPVTCSMGALAVPASDDHTRRELMREADRLMYEAKRAGKNAVRFAPMARPVRYPPRQRTTAARRTQGWCSVAGRSAYIWMSNGMPRALANTPKRSLCRRPQAHRMRR